MDLQTTTTDFPDQLRLVELVRKWAEVNTDGLLDKATQLFSVPHIEGFIGYRIELGNAIIFGDPVCASKDKVALAKEFESYCRNKKILAVYIIVTEEFANLAVEQLSFSAIEFGTKFILDPLKYVVSPTTLLRKKIRQSSRNGVEICEYTGNDINVEQSLQQVANEWVQARKGIQVYLAEPDLFSNRLGKRWFYAKHEERIIGFVLLNELQSHQGWLLNNVMFLKDSPSGISEHLVVSALQTLEKEQCRFVLIGPVPAKELGKIMGFGQTITLVVRWLFKAIRKICRLDGHEIFWEKFEPEVGSSYLLFPKKRFRFSSIIALLRALNISLR
jgi:lysylphosphatidylglycerol synthetase-like protein (DUF2156 family)